MDKNRTTKKEVLQDREDSDFMKEKKVDGKLDGQMKMESNNKIDL